MGTEPVGAGVPYVRVVAVNDPTSVPVATHVEIRYTRHSDETERVIRIPLPFGSLEVIPATQSFARVRGVDGQDTTLQRFTLRNSGQDCLVIDGIEDRPPFQLTEAGRALFNPPERWCLRPQETMVVEVEMLDGPDDSFDESLPVTVNPGAGGGSLHCVGVRRQAITAVTCPLPTLEFGALRFEPAPAASSDRTVTIAASGELPVTIQGVNVVGTDANAFVMVQPTAPAGTLLQPGDTLDITMQFTPRRVGSHRAGLAISHSAPMSPCSTELSGAGCSELVRIELPNEGVLDFGEVERGFRTVRLLRVSNSGGAQGRIGARVLPAGTGPNESGFFGLERPEGLIGDVTPQRSYIVAPRSSCGGAALEVEDTLVAVEFFAVGEPRTVHAILHIMVDQAAGQPAAERTYSLTAKVVPMIPVDVGLVLDRSQTMGDSLGARRKIEALARAGELLVLMLRPNEEDRLSMVSFNEQPKVLQEMALLTSDNQASSRSRFRVGGDGMVVDDDLRPSGNSAVAGGFLIGTRQLNRGRDTEPSAPAKRIMIVATDAKDDRSYWDEETHTMYSLVQEWTWFEIQILPGWSIGPFTLFGRTFTITFRPVVITVPAPTNAVPKPDNAKIYGIGIGSGESLNQGRLDTLVNTAGGIFLLAFLLLILIIVGALKW